MYKKYFKRSLDFFVSLLALLLFSWLFLIIIISIKLTSKGPIFFLQTRIGMNKRQFNIIKFRTMKVDTPRDLPTHLMKNPDMYITNIGRLLRKTSLDELPQIINIILNDMSIIGPRPALWNQYDLIEERDTYGVNSVKPGLTGWAQINGRDELSIKEKARLDGEYIDKMNFVFDLKCLIKTIRCVIKQDGLKEGALHDISDSRL